MAWKGREQDCYILMKPHSYDPMALEATARTIEGLPGRHVVTRDDFGVVLIDGEFEVRSSDPGFILWAATRQGYVESARKGLPLPSTEAES